MDFYFVVFICCFLCDCFAPHGVAFGEIDGYIHLINKSEKILNSGRHIISPTERSEEKL